MSKHTHTHIYVNTYNIHTCKYIYVAYACVCVCVVRSYLPAQQLFCFGSSAATVHSQCCQRQLLLLRRFHTLNVRSSSVSEGSGRIICCHVVVIADSLPLSISFFVW